MNMSILTAYKNITLAIVNLVNTPRGSTYNQYRNKILLKPAQQQQFIETAKMVADHHLALGALGELSLRVSPQQLVINAQGSHLAYLTETDLVTCSTLPGKPAEAAAPHLNWHRLIYRETPAESVLFCHPPYSLTLANTAKLPLQETAPEIEAVIGGVNLIKPSYLTEAHLAEVVQQNHVILVPQLGALIWGNSMVNVLVRADALEFVSQLTAIAYQTGLMPTLSTKNQ
jgi:ribulose-5-phosphate 4-epimerase/fuculose-1-phosphate aldolase